MKTSLAPQIASDPDIMSGRPMIEGTRITVELVLSDITAGESLDDIQSNYRLTRDQVIAALRYARSLLPESETVAAI